MAPKTPQHKNKARYTHLSTKPKVDTQPHEAVYMVVNTSAPDAPPLGTDLTHKAAKHLQSRLSSSHKCRTAKVVRMPEPPPADLGEKPSPPAPIVRPSAPGSGPPPSLIAGAAAAAKTAAEEAQRRHDAKHATHVERQRVIDLAEKSRVELAEDEAIDTTDVGDLSDLLGGEDPADVADDAAAGADAPTGRPPVPETEGVITGGDATLEVTDAPAES